MFMQSVIFKILPFKQMHFSFQTNSSAVQTESLFEDNSKQITNNFYFICH